MAKYTVTHTCGHTSIVQLFGKLADRDRRIAWLETCECQECRIKKANAKAIKAKEARGLCDLVGSEKQCSWANTIREKAYKALDCLAPYAKTNEAKAIIDEFRSKMDAKTEAKWWIDNRFEMPEPLVTSGETKMDAARVILGSLRSLLGGNVIAADPRA